MTEPTVNQEDIFGPMFAMFFLTTMVGFCMFSRRVPFLLTYTKKNKISNEEIANPSSRHHLSKISPSAVLNPSDNLKNLFEHPVLFYAVVVYLFVTSQVDIWYIRAAWNALLFLLFRAGYNHFTRQSR